MVCIFFTPFGMHPSAMQRLFNLSPVVDFFLASHLCSVFFFGLQKQRRLRDRVFGLPDKFWRLFWGFFLFLSSTIFYFRILERFFGFVAAAHPSSPLRPPQYWAEGNNSAPPLAASHLLIYGWSSRIKFGSCLEFR
jgi:hypothetical protein